MRQFLRRVFLVSACVIHPRFHWDATIMDEPVRVATYAADIRAWMVNVLLVIAALGFVRDVVWFINLL